MSTGSVMTRVNTGAVVIWEALTLDVKIGVEFLRKTAADVALSWLVHPRDDTAHLAHAGPCARMGREAP